MFTSIEIPHLAAGQKISEYKKVFLAATESLHKDEQCCACLPIYIYRTEGEKQIAFAAVNEEDINKAFKFLEDNIDGPPCLFTESSKFFDIKSRDSTFMDAIRSYYFELLKVATHVEMSGEAFLKRFFTNIPGGKRFLELDEVRKELKPKITRAVLLTMFKTIMPKIQNKLSGHDSAAPVEGDQFLFPISSEKESEQPPSSYKTTSIIFGHEWNQTNLAAQKKRRIIAAKPSKSARGPHILIVQGVLGGWYFKCVLGGF